MSQFIGRDALLEDHGPRRMVYTFPDNLPGLAGKKLLLQAPTHTERAAWEASLLNPKTGMNDPKRMKEMRERLIVMCAVSEDGNRILKKTDVDTLKARDGAIVVGIFNALSRMMAADDEDLEDLVGNSPETTDDCAT